MSRLYLLSIVNRFFFSFFKRAEAPIRSRQLWGREGFNIWYLRPEETVIPCSESWKVLLCMKLSKHNSIWLENTYSSTRYTINIINFVYDISLVDAFKNIPTLTLYKDGTERPETYFIYIYQSEWIVFVANTAHRKYIWYTTNADKAKFACLSICNHIHTTGTVSVNINVFE